MVSPRTPIRTRRYGPSLGGAGGLRGSNSNGGVNHELRHFFPRVSLDIKGVAENMHGFEFYRNNNISSMSEWDQTINDRILVERAQEAYERAQREGHATVEMEEREWDAWQKHLNMEREIERRVAERLEAEKRRKVMIPTSLTRQLSNKPVLATSAPGFLTEKGFEPIQPSSPSKATTMRREISKDSLVSNSSTRSLPEAREVATLPRSLRSGLRPNQPFTTPATHSDIVEDVFLRQPLPSDLSPQKPSNHYNASISSQSETHLVRYVNDGNIGSDPSLGLDTNARRRKRAELRRQLDL